MANLYDLILSPPIALMILLGFVALYYAFLHIVTPSGKTGFVPMDMISSLGGDAMCYAKGATGWTIAGYFGGAGQ